MDDGVLRVQGPEGRDSLHHRVPLPSLWESCKTSAKEANNGECCPWWLGAAPWCKLAMMAGSNQPAELSLLNFRDAPQGSTSCATSQINQSAKTPSAKSRAGPKSCALQYLLTLLAGLVGELRMRSSVQAVGLLLLAYTFGSRA